MIDAPSHAAASRDARDQLFREEHAWLVAVTTALIPPMVCDAPSILRSAARVPPPPGAPVRFVLCVLRPEGTAARWTPAACAMSDSDGAQRDAAAQSLASGVASLDPPGQVLFRESELAPGERQFRRGAGLHAGVRAVVSAPGRRQTERVAVECAGRTASWRPSMEDARRCLTLATVVAHALDRWVSRPAEARHGLLDRLTPAQRAVAEPLVREVREARIAAALDRSVHTIHDHIKGVFRAWRVHTKAEALWRWDDPLHARWAELDRGRARRPRR